ncbi:hypothetical protein ACFSE1_00115 [Rhizobium helianthi]|uniref:DNA repair protein n=1 Tax=Rhizobium helianthi TaxID=1132695 RepID=A0ABW4LXF5_9HYPH
MRLKSYILLATASFAFQAGLLGLPANHLAHADVLSSQQLEQFQAELQRVEDGRKGLTSQADCLKNFVVKQQEFVSERELALGEALNRQHALEARVAQLQQEFHGHAALLQAESVNMAQRAAAVEHARRERDEQAARLKTCNDVLFFLPGICKAGEEAVIGIGWMNNAEADLRAAEPRLREAQNGFNEVQQRLAQSSQQLAETQQDHQRIREVVTQTELTIAHTKAANSRINEKIQDFNRLAVNFSATLGDAADLDMDDVRLRTINRLIEEGRSLTSAMPAFIEVTRSELPEEARRTCSL